MVVIAHARVRACALFFFAACGEPFHAPAYCLLGARAVVLFSTDIAARGLDFPAVDWVLQMDCPEDVNTYIHRVGRTARYNAGGKALLLLLPAEAPFAGFLRERKVGRGVRFWIGLNSHIKDG